MNSKERTTKRVGHPLEDLFELPPNTTEITVSERKTTLIQYPEFDVKDVEIETQFQEIYDVAMSTFDNAVDLIERSESEPKDMARQMEVAATFLSTALNAAKEKAGLKSGKDKLIAAARLHSGKGGQTADSVVMDHATLLKLLRGEKPEEPIIDGEIVEEQNLK